MFSHPPTEVFNGGNSTTASGVSTRQPIPGVASLRVNPERIERMWQMTAQQRVEAAQQGQFTLGEMLRWASRRPSEAPLVDGELFFISFLTRRGDSADRARGLGGRAHAAAQRADPSAVAMRKASSDTSHAAAAAGRDTSSSGTR